LIFPGGEIVDWDGRDTTNIYLPGSQYWRNVEGLCGRFDATNIYCQGPDNTIYTEEQRESCSNSWILQNQGLKRFIAQDSNNDTLLDNSTIIYDNYTLPGNDTIFYQNDTEIPPHYSTDAVNSTAFIVYDNFLSKAATKICVFFF